MTPNTSTIIIETMLWAGLGHCYGKIAEVSCNRSAQVFAISHLADTIFFLITKKAAKTEYERDATYAFTNLIVNAMTVVAMRHLELIGTIGSVAFSSMAIWNYVGRSVTAEQLRPL